MGNIWRIDKFLIASFGLFGFIFWHLAKEMLQVKSDGWYAGHINLWGDLAFHLTLINKFLESGEILPDNPIFAKDLINYPILADWATAQIARTAGIDFSLFITTFLVGILVIFVARIFILNFIKNEKVVFLTLLLFFVNGGLGFYYFFIDFLTSHKTLSEILLALPGQYTDIKDQGYWWINNYLAYFLPQRPLLFAFPITLIILLLLYQGYKKQVRIYFLLAGVLSGVLPIVQAHSLFLLFLLSLVFAPVSTYLSKTRQTTFANWLIFGLVASVIALPLFGTISSTGNPLRFIHFDPGWTSQENIFWFWLKNLGLFAPMLMFSLVWLYRKNRHLFLLYLPFLAVFFLSNLFVFQPWDFDNSKLLIYWYFASVIVVAYFLYDQFFQEDTIRKILGAGILFLMVLAGGLDLLRTFTPVTNYRMYSKQEIEVANVARQLTPKDSIFLTASNHNHPIVNSAGRSTFLGYPGWLWSHGLDYTGRVQDVVKIYSGAEDAEKLIAKYRIGYVTVGPLERTEFSINESFFNKYPVISLGYDWQLYDVSHLWSYGDR